MPPVTMLPPTACSTAPIQVRAALFPREAGPAILRLVRLRVYGAQALYLAAMLLAVIDTHWTIAVIVAIQLNFALAPPIPFLRRL